MLLAIDTSTRSVGVALYDGVRVIHEAIWTSQDYHTVELAPAVAEMIEHSGVDISDLELLAVATGPGSFTGLRIGMALAKGLALAQHLRMIGIPTLDVLASAQPVRDVPMSAVLQAGRGRLAVRWYTVESGKWTPTGEAEVLDVKALSKKIQSPTYVCGELTEEERRILKRKRKNVILASPAQSQRRPAFLAELAWERWQAGEVDNAATLAPEYIHIGEPIPG
jgi:tRNA threonylcarbamoyladenosine biosynthesis protein TsaB